MDPKVHPNATAGGLTGLFTSLLLYEANKRGISIDVYEAGGIVSAVVYAVLFFGKKTGVMK